ncbi:hypothetical protein PF70_01899 [Pseudomonas asplenii]|nr:hypothetical protein PF70_01899 [Pseudomonas fuscovaginae]
MIGRRLALSINAAIHFRRAILEHMDNFKDASVAQQRLSDIQSGRSNAITLEELEQLHGVERSDC